MLIGTEKPMFCAKRGLAIAVLIPTTSPAVFRSGPPEFPKLMAASVWMRLSNERLASERFAKRPLPETTPTVTVFSKPSGSPIAITQSPTRRRSESPSVTIGNGFFPSIFRRARSVAGSRPTIFAS